MDKIYDVVIIGGGPGGKVTVDERMNLVVKIANHETGKMEALEEN